MVKELLRNHSSVRIYDGNPISKEIIEELIATAQMAATIAVSIHVINVCRSIAFPLFR